MPHIVTHLSELVKNHAVRLLLQFMCLVKDLLYVRLGTRSSNDLAGYRLQPLKTLTAHSFRKDRYRMAAQQLGIESTASAVITGGWPDCPMIGGIKLSCHKRRHQASKGCSDLVAACRKIFPHKQHNFSFHSGQLRRKHDIIGIPEQTSAFLRFVLPGNTEQVQRIHIP